MPGTSHGRTPATRPVSLGPVVVRLWSVTGRVAMVRVGQWWSAFSEVKRSFARGALTSQSASTDLRHLEPERPDLAFAWSGRPSGRRGAVGVAATEGSDGPRSVSFGPQESSPQTRDRLQTRPRSRGELGPRTRGTGART